MTAMTWSAVLVGAATLVWPVSGAAGVRLADFRGSRTAARIKARTTGRPARRGRPPGWPWARSTSALRHRDLVGLLEGLAATLRAGLTPARALHHLAATQPLSGQSPEGLRGAALVRGAELGTPDELVSRLASEAAAGGPLEWVWRREAQVRGSPDLLAVAEGWALSERHGASLVDVLDVVVGALRDRARMDAAIEAALAAPRATARLLGVLPLGGLVLGELVGVHPLSVLLGTSAGRVVGCAGIACTYAGQVWMRRLVAGVTRVSDR